VPKKATKPAVTKKAVAKKAAAKKPAAVKKAAAKKPAAAPKQGITTGSGSARPPVVHVGLTG
jgi:hypothetical protein